MANPKKRKTHSKSRMGRSHLALKKETLVKCPKCGEKKKPHRTCQICGSYKDKEVVKPKIKAVKTK